MAHRFHLYHEIQRTYAPRLPNWLASRLGSCCSFSYHLDLWSVCISLLPLHVSYAPLYSGAMVLWELLVSSHGQLVQVLYDPCEYQICSEVRKRSSSYELLPYRHYLHLVAAYSFLFFSLMHFLVHLLLRHHHQLRPCLQQVRHPDLRLNLQYHSESQPQMPPRLRHGDPKIDYNCNHHLQSYFVNLLDHQVQHQRHCPILSSQLLLALA